MNLTFLGPFGFHPNKTMRSRALPLARALVERGHRVQLVMPPWQTPEEGSKKWQEDGVDLVYVNLSGGIIPIVRRMIANATGYNSDVIHGFKPKAYSGLAMWWLWQSHRFRPTQTKLFTDTDDWEGWGGWNDIAPYATHQKYFFAWQEQWGLNHTQLLTVASRELQNKAIESGQKAANMLYLPNGPGINAKHNVRLEDVVARRQALGLENRPTLLLYSRLFEFDIQRLTAILQRVKAAIPDLAILSIGTGLFNDDQTSLQDHFRTAGLLNSVIDMGWLEEKELPLALLSADVGLYLMDDTLLNRTKCPVKLADMIAVGLPIAGEAVGQVSEYVISGENGLLRSSGDVEGAAADCIDLLKTPGKRAAFGHNSRARWQKLFSWEKQAERYERRMINNQ